MYIFIWLKYDGFWKIKYIGYYFSIRIFIRLNKFCLGFILKSDNLFIVYILVEKYILNKFDI